MESYNKTYSKFNPKNYRTRPRPLHAPIDRGCGSLTCAQHLSRVERISRQLAERIDELERENASLRKGGAA